MPKYRGHARTNGELIAEDNSSDDDYPENKEDIREERRRRIEE
jgi:hypothetical protein